MNHNSLHDPQGGNYGSYTPSASMGFRYNWDICCVIIILLLYTWMCVQMKMYIHCTYTCKHAADYRKYR